MRRITLFLFPLLALLALAWWTGAFAQADDVPKPQPVILTDEQDKYPLGLHLEILEDPNGELTIEDVASPEFDSRFTPSQVEVPNYGFTDSAYWVQLFLDNESRLNERWLLEVGFANMHFVDLYTPLPDGDGFEVKQTGTLRPLETRDIPNPRIVFNLAIPTQSQQTIYLRFQNGASMTLPLTLLTPNAFFVESQQDLLRYGLFFGVMIGLLAYNLFLFFSLREVTYLYLSIFLANMIFFEATYDGYTETYIFPNLYYLRIYYQPLSFTLIFVSILLFSNSFLEVKSRLPKLQRVYIVILSVWGALMLLTPFTSYHNLALLMAPWGLTSLLTALFTGFISWRQDFRQARFFMIAWIGAIFTLFIVLLVRLGVISSTFIAENAYHFGLVWMAVCWSIALADRINLLKTETESANRDLRSSEHRLAQILEGLPLGVVVYGKDFKPSFANQRVNEILGNPARGIDPDISAGRTLAEAMEYYSFRVKDSDQEYPLENLPVYRALHGEQASADDAEADLVDRRVPLEIWASPVLDDAGDVESAVVAFQDIAARKQSEKALRASEKKFRVIVENNFDGIIFMARDRTISYVSPSYEKLIGFTAQEMVGKSGAGFVHPDDRGRIADVFAELLQQPGRRFSDEYRLINEDGSVVWIETNAMNLLDDPYVGAVVLNSRNITERKQTETALAEYRQHLESLVEKRTEELSAANERLNHEIIEREILEQLLYQHIEWLTTLNQVRQTIGGTADLPQAYDMLFPTILQLLDARVVFLIRWDSHGEQIEAFCQLEQDDSIRDLDGMASIIKSDSPLREEIELGKPVHLSADRSTSLPEPLLKCFQENGFQSLILEPVIVHQSVSSVLGVAIPQPIQNFTPAQAELVENMTLDLVELAEDAQLLDQARALVAAEERNRLARDLHDSVTQVLFSANLVAEVLPKIWRRNPEQALQSLEELRRLTRGALAEMRTMLLELRPASVLKTPMPELLAQLTEAITSRTELPFKLFIEQITPLPDDVHTSFYRIAQEALNNVVKHAQANQVTVSLSATLLTPDSTGGARYQVKLVIEDDGVGYSPRDGWPEHLGIGIMRERSAAIQATLSVDSQPGYGTRVTLTWCSELENSS